MNTFVKAISLSLLCLSLPAMAATSAIDDPRGKFLGLDPKAPNEKLLITPLSCKVFVEMAVEITGWYLNGVSTDTRITLLGKGIADVVHNDEKYAGSGLAVRFSSSIITVLSDPAVKKDIGFGYTYQQSVARQMPKMCAQMVGTTTDHVQRKFENKL